MTQCDDFANEEWRPVVGYEDLYEVSCLGRIRRVKAGYRKSAGTIMKTPSDGKYVRCGLWRDGKCYSGLLHRVVATAFLGESPTGYQANHIDGDKSNNKLSNLEWITSRENIEHAFEIGLKSSGENHVFSKLSEADVKEIKASLSSGVKGSALARRFNVTHSNISSIKNGKTWRFLAA